MAEYLHIVLPHLCNEQATHTISPRHFGIMYINRNAFKETTWTALNTALIITAILKQVTYIILSRSLWNWTAEINLKTWSTSGLVAWGIWASDQPDHRHTHPQSLFLMWGRSELRHDLWNSKATYETDPRDEENQWDWCQLRKRLCLGLTNCLFCLNGFEF